MTSKPAPKTPPKLSPAPTERLRPSAVTPMEAWYLEALEKLHAHHRRAPSLAELATYAQRSRTAVYQALLRMERKGRLGRDEAGHFVVIGP